MLWTNTAHRTYQLIRLLIADRTHRDHQTQGNLLLHWLQKDMNYVNKRTHIFNDKTWCLHRAATTLWAKSKAYSAAFVCCTQTCCRVEYCVETLCNRHCEILSFLLVWPCAVSETTLAFSFKRLNFLYVLHYHFIISTSQKRLYIMCSGSRKFPFFGKVRNSAVGCESSLSDGASWDDPVHSNSCLCHLKNAKTFKWMLLTQCCNSVNCITRKCVIHTFSHERSFTGTILF